MSEIRSALVIGGRLLLSVIFLSIYILLDEALWPPLFELGGFLGVAMILIVGAIEVLSLFKFVLKE